MKKILVLLSATPLMLSACGKDTPAPIIKGTSLSSYGGTLTDGFALNKTLPNVTFDNDTFTYSHYLELRTADVLRIENVENKTVDNIFDFITNPISDTMTYCPNGTTPTIENFFTKNGSVLESVAHLANVDKRKVSTEVVDLTSSDNQVVATKYEAYLDSMDNNFKENVLTCNDIGTGKTHATIKDWVETGGFGGNPQSFFPIYRSAGEVKLTVDSNYITLGFDQKYFTDSFSISKKVGGYLTPMLGLNLDQGQSYLRTNWLSKIPEGAVTVGKY